MRALPPPSRARARRASSLSMMSFMDDAVSWMTQFHGQCSFMGQALPESRSVMHSTPPSGLPEAPRLPPTAAYSRAHRSQTIHRILIATCLDTLPMVATLDHPRDNKEGISEWKLRNVPAPLEPKPVGSSVASRSTQ